MTFLLDECADHQIGDRLGAEGHAILFVSEMDPGVPDEIVLSLANERGAILVTADKDFGELVFRARRATGGVLLVRLAGLSPDAKADAVAAAVEAHGHEMARAFSVVSPGRVRVRRRV